MNTNVRGTVRVQPSQKRVRAYLAGCRDPLPVQGTATYWSVNTGQGARPDLAWAYRAPLAEGQKIAGLACFYDEKVDGYVDGERQERPRTQFS